MIERLQNKDYNMLAKDLMNMIDHEHGYVNDFKISDAELSTLRNIIKAHWLYRIQLLVPEHVSKFDEAGMDHYHALAHLIDHQSVWYTASRILSREAVDRIKEISLFKQLSHLFGSIQIADEGKFGWENMLWRLVRPCNHDCASIHTDRWFWDLATDWKIPEIG